MILLGETPEPFDVAHAAVIARESTMVPGDRVMAALDEGERIIAHAERDAVDARLESCDQDASADAALHMRYVVECMRMILAGGR